MAIVADVPAVFLLREIEAFLESQSLLISVAEQRTEAKRFFRMIQLETGLIVERGTNEAGEALFGFIHRTFQEYFAAMDVYERYQKEEDSAVVSNFLQTYLYDPHWHEVVMLLLGKLKRKPVTAQLLQVLDGKIKNHLNNYRDILHNDLFFVSSCLKEDVSVEKELAVQVILKLGHLAASSPFRSQRSEALESLTSLKNTRQYGELTSRTLWDLLTQNALDDLVKMQVAEAVYLGSPRESKEQIQARQILMGIASSSYPPFNTAEEILGRTYFACSGDVVMQQDIGHMLHRLVERPTTTFDEALSWYEGMLYAEKEEYQENLQGTPLVRSFIELIRRPSLSLEQKVEAIETLYLRTAVESEESMLATQMLLELLQQPDLLPEQLVLVAQALYRCSIALSEEKRIAAQILLKLAEHPHISTEEVGGIARTIFNYQTSKYRIYRPTKRDEEYSQVLQILRKRLLRTSISFEESVLINNVVCTVTSMGSDEHRQALERLSLLSQLSDITFEQQVQATGAFIENCSLSSLERENAIQNLVTLLECPNLTVEQILYLAQTIYNYSQKVRGPNEIEIVFEPRVMSRLYKITEHPDISFEQLISIVQFLYKDENPLIFFETENSITASRAAGGVGHEKSEARSLAKRLMENLLKNPDLTESRQLQILTIPFKTKLPDISDLAYSIRKLTSVLGETSAGKYLEEHLPQIDWHLAIHYGGDSSKSPFLEELIKREDLPMEFRNGLYVLLRQYFPLYWYWIEKDSGAYKFIEEEE